MHADNLQEYANEKGDKVATLSLYDIVNEMRAFFVALRINDKT